MLSSFISLWRIPLSWICLIDSHICLKMGKAVFSLRPSKCLFSNNHCNKFTPLTYSIMMVKSWKFSKAPIYLTIPACGSSFSIFPIIISVVMYSKDFCSSPLLLIFLTATISLLLWMSMPKTTLPKDPSPRILSFSLNWKRASYSVLYFFSPCQILELNSN